MEGGLCSEIAQEQRITITSTLSLKLHFPSHGRFFSLTPTPWKFRVSFIPLYKTFGFWKPILLGIFIILPWGWYGC